MGPLFSLALLAILGSLATGVTFVVTRFFLPMRPALALAVLMVAAGGLGCFLGMLFQIVFMGEEFIMDEGPALFILGILASGVLSAVGALWVFLRWRTGRIRQAEAQTFD